MSREAKHAGMRVLVTDDGYRPALGIVRSLGRKGMAVSVLSNGQAALASRSRYCASKYDVPGPGEADFGRAVVELAQRVPFDLIIPVGYLATAALAREKEALAPLTRLETVPYGKIRAAADKAAIDRLAREVGIPSPETHLPSGFEEAAKLSAALRYPVVIKAPRETANANVYYANTREELLPVYRAACARAARAGHPFPLIQEFIPGFGCGFFALYDRGACKRIFMHRRVREVPPSGGQSCCADSFYDARLKDYGRRLLDRLEWHGVAMVEFRYDVRDGDYKVMEVNPKFWGSLDLALEAGVNFPWYLCQIARGEELAYSEEYDRRLRYHWPALEIQHVFERPRSLPAVLRDSLRPRVRSDFDLRDPRPHLLNPLARARRAAGRWFQGAHARQPGSASLEPSHPQKAKSI